MVKVLLTGPLDSISKYLVELLVQEGNVVSVITDSTARRNEVEAIGAVALTGSIEDPAFVASACDAADVVCVKVPSEHSEVDHDAFYHSRAAESAVQSLRVKKVILLSTIKSHIREGKGIVLSSLQLDQIKSDRPSIGSMRPHVLRSIKDKIHEASPLKATNKDNDRSSLGDLRPHLLRQVLSARRGESGESSLTSPRPRLVHHLLHSLKGMIHPQSPAQLHPRDVYTPDTHAAHAAECKHIAEAIAEEVQASTSVDAKVCYMLNDISANGDISEEQAMHDMVQI